MRYVITPLLMLRFLAGPCLCCCTAASLSPAQPATTPVKESRCCHEEKSAPATDDAPREEPATRCQCHAVQLGLPPAIAKVAADESWFAVTFASESLAGLDRGTQSSSLNATDAPFHSAAEILRAFHIMRC